MKIAIVTPDDLSTLIFCDSIAEILSKQEKIELTTISDVDMYEEELNQIKSSHIKLFTPRWFSPLYDIVYFLRLLVIFKRGNFDLVLTFTTKPNIYGPLAAKLAGVPKIATAIRGLGQAFNNRRGIRQYLLTRGVELLFRLSLKHVDLAWFTNKNDLRYFVDSLLIHEKKTLLTRNALNLKKFNMGAVSKSEILTLKKELDLKEQDQVALMVARLIESKGVRDFMNAAIEMKSLSPDIKFLLVAPIESQSWEAISVDEVRSVEDKANFKWVGFRKDVKAIYALSDISILPSKYREGGYPRALLEAMAFAKPVIAANTDDCRGPVHEGLNGYLVEPGNHEQLCKLIYKVLSDHNKKISYGNYSLKLIRDHFDDRVVVRRLLTELELV